MIILLIEDEYKLTEVLKRGLELERYVVDVAYDGEEGFKKALKNDYDVIILDVLLPKKDGFSICSELREKGIDTPIIILSAKGNEKDKVRGLDSGADDYISKPFSFEEFLARIRSVLRCRKGDGKKKSKLEIDDLVLDPISHEVRRNGKLIELTPKEYNLLDYLMRYPNEALNREQLLNHIWGIGKNTKSNKLDVCVRYLRHKIDDSFKKKLIKTVRGVGYKIKE